MCVFDGYMHSNTITINIKHLNGKGDNISCEIRNDIKQCL